MAFQSQWANYLTTNYNHEQRSLDTFAFLGRFANSHRSNPSPHPTNNVGRVCPDFFLKFQHCVGWGRENFKKISKRMHCFKREPRNDRKIWILQYCPKDFCPGLSESWFWGKSLLSSFFLCFLDILETSRSSHAIIMTFETISST